MTDPKYIIVGPINYAMFEAYAKYGKRNWRRIKREVNKAIKRAKWKLRANG
jgi:hypothetical protein